MTGAALALAAWSIDADAQTPAPAPATAAAAYARIRAIAREHFAIPIIVDCSLRSVHWALEAYAALDRELFEEARADAPLTGQTAAEMRWYTAGAADTADQLGSGEVAQYGAATCALASHAPTLLKLDELGRAADAQ